MFVKDQDYGLDWIFALFLANLLWFPLNDDDVALPACRLKYNFFFAENGRSLRFNGDKAF